VAQGFGIQSKSSASSVPATLKKVPNGSDDIGFINPMDYQWIISWII